MHQGPLIARGTYQRTNNFDILRIILAFMVVFHHTMKLYGYNSDLLIFWLGDFAVHSFFIISGLLVTWSFDNNRDTVAYSTRRFFRIYPLYFVMIVIQMLLMIFFNERPFDGFLLMSSIKYFICNILFLNFLDPVIPGAFEDLKYHVVNGSLWTIKIEVLFYIFLPFIYRAFKKFRLKALLVLYFLSAFSSVIFRSSPHFSDQLPVQMRFFVIGMILYFYGYKMKAVFLRSLLIPCILFLANCFLEEQLLYEAFVSPVIIGFIVYSVGFYKSIFKVKYDVSYSTYLIHFPLIQFLLFFGCYFHNFYFFLGTILVAVSALSLLSFIYLERKFVAFGHQLSVKRLKSFPFLAIGRQIENICQPIRLSGEKPLLCQTSADTDRENYK